MLTKTPHAASLPRATIFGQTECEESYTTAVALERTTEGRSQRIIVFGDADCFSNSEMTIQREYGNHAR